MKKIFLSLSLFVGFSAVAQEVAEMPANGWTRAGNISLLFNQAAFNHDWTGGGTSNYGGNLSFSYDANLRYNAWTWDNKLLADYGFTNTEGEEFARKTNDRLSFNSVVGRQASKEWFYSFFLNFQTQIDKGYKYDKDASGKAIRTDYTDFMSPGYLSFGPGMLWKKSDNLKVNIAPATSRLIFVKSKHTLTDSFFGVEKGETFRYEFGASVNAYAKFDIVENVTMENTLNLYSNYLDKPQNVDIDYTLNLIMKVNNYLSANFTLQTIYDDDAVGAFQVREAFGAGITYKF